MCATTEPSAFKIYLFRSHKCARQGSSVLCGAPLRLLYKEADGSVARVADDAVVATESAGKQSSNAVWEVRRADSAPPLSPPP